MYKTLESVVIPIAALLMSLLVFGIFMLAVGANPLAVYESIYRGAFGTWFSWQNTMVRAAPLMLTALCTALPARMGLIVIGGEGAVVVGGLAAAMTGLAFSGYPAVVGTGVMMFAAVASGGLWIAAVGALKYYRGVNETISGLLLNYIAIAVMNFLIIGLLRDPATLNKPATHAIDDAFWLTEIGNSSVHWGFVISVLTCVGLWMLYRRMVFGFSVDVAGGNPRAAQIVGIPVGKLIVISCFLGGAAAGLAGMIEVAAIHGRANTSLNAGYGYEGILIAFLARHNPIAIIPAAILLGGIRAASGLLQRELELPDATSLVMQGIIFVVILASEYFYGKFKIFNRGVEKL
jgi:simple sugar transport system permease protein